MIPWYIDEKWDFKTYSVCKKAYRELVQLFDKPNIILDYSNPILQKNQTVYETIVYHCKEIEVLIINRL